MNQPPSTPDLNPPAAPRRRWRRRLVIAALFLAAVIALLPWATVLPPVRNAVAARLSRETHASIQFDRLRIGWLSPLRVENITVSTAAGEPVFRIAELRSRKNLLGLVSGPEKGVIELRAPVATVRMRDRDSNLQDLLRSFKKADPRRGLLGVLIHPDRDVHVVLDIQNASLFAEDDKTQPAETTPDPKTVPPIASDVQLQLELERRSGDLVVGVAPGQILQGARVTRELCDYGLKYVAPILANATDMDGRISLELDACRVPVNHLDAAVLQGRIRVETLESEVQSPLLKEVVVAIEKLLDRPDPGRLYLADNSVIEFHTENGRIHHEGLKFGLPKLSEDLIVETNGEVGFDQSLDVMVHVPLPFGLLGDGALLQRLGENQLRLQVTGTLAEPQVKLPNDGSLIGGLVKSLGGDAEDAELAPLLEGLGDTAAATLRKLRERRQEKKANDPQPEKDSEDGKRSRLKRGLGRLLENLKEAEGKDAKQDQD